MTTDVPAFGPPPGLVLLDEADADPEAEPEAEPDAEPLAEPEAEPLAEPEAEALADPLPLAEPEAVELPGALWLAPSEDADMNPEDDSLPLADPPGIGGMMSLGSLSCPFRPLTETSTRLYFPEFPSQWQMTTFSSFAEAA